MWNTDPRPLPDWIKHAYEVLATHIGRCREGGITRERAYELLLADAEFEDEPADATYAVRYLLTRGWLYEVDDELRVTEPER